METPHFTTATNDTRSDIFDKVSNELWGDISEAIASDFSTPTDIFEHVQLYIQAMREITDRITDKIPTGVRSAVYLDRENHDLKKVEPINN